VFIKATRSTKMDESVRHVFMIHPTPLFFWHILNIRLAYIQVSLSHKTVLLSSLNCLDCCRYAYLQFMIFSHSIHIFLLDPCPFTLKPITFNICLKVVTSQSNMILSFNIGRSFLQIGNITDYKYKFCSDIVYFPLVKFVYICILDIGCFHIFPRVNNPPSTMQFVLGFFVCCFVHNHIAVICGCCVTFLMGTPLYRYFWM